MAPPIGEPFSSHWLPLAALELRVTLPPAQKVVGPPGVMVGAAGNGLTVTVIVLDTLLTQPNALSVAV